MTFALFLTIGLLAAVVIFASPKLGSVMIWPILFMYPHNWWHHNGFFPYHAGADDAFCILLFLVVVVRINIIDRQPIRTGFAFWVITVFTIISASANFVGAQESVTSVERIEAIKGVLKPMVFWALFYSIVHCIDNTRDLKIQFTMFAVSATLGASLVILQNFFPQQLNIFALPRSVDYLSGFTYESRGAGAFTNPNAAACVLGSSILLSMAAMRLQTRALMKVFLYAIIVVLLVGILYTRSRSGLMALGTCVVLMLFVGRSKSVALWCILGGAVVGAAFVGARELLTERITQAYDAETGVVGGNVLGRIDMWWTYLTESSLRDYLLGQGSSTAVAKHGMESHNAYVSLLTVYGVGGAVWAVVALVGFVRRVRSSLRSGDSTIATVAAGSMWALLFWGLYAWTADAISSSYARFLLFYIVVLVDRAHAFACQLPERQVNRDASVERLKRPAYARPNLAWRRV